MNRKLMAYLLDLSPTYLAIWAYIWLNTDENGIAVITISQVVNKLRVHKEVVRRALNADPTFQFYNIQEKPDESSPRWNSRKIEVQFFEEPEIISIDDRVILTDFPEKEDIDEVIGKKIAGPTAKHKHWIVQYIEENLPNVFKIETQPSFQQAKKLESMYPEDTIVRKLKHMENYKRGKKHCYELYSTVFFTLDEWCKKEMKSKGAYRGNQENIAIKMGMGTGEKRIDQLAEFSSEMNSDIESGNITIERKNKK